MRGLDISQVSSSHVGTTPSIVIWLNIIYYTTDQPFTWRNDKSLVHSYSAFSLTKRALFFDSLLKRRGDTVLFY